MGNLKEKNLVWGHQMIEPDKGKRDMQNYRDTFRYL